LQGTSLFSRQEDHTSTSLTAAKQLAILAIKFDVMHTESASFPGKKQHCLQWQRMARASASCV